MKIFVCLLFLMSSCSAAFADEPDCTIGKYTYDARIIDRSNGRHGVYDGDTVWLRVRLGFGIEYDLGPTRLFGINAPELRGSQSADGYAARDFLNSQLPVDEWFQINSIQDDKGKYGRYLVTLCPNGVNVNRLLVTEGHAEFRDY